MGKKLSGGGGEGSVADVQHAFGFDCTRRIFVRLADGVTSEQFLAALNDRRVKIDGTTLTDGYTGAPLGERVLAVNVADYTATNEMCDFDTLDPYKFGYNDI